MWKRLFVEKKVFSAKWLKKIGLGHLSDTMGHKGPKEDVSGLGLPDTCIDASAEEERAQKVKAQREYKKKVAKWKKQKKNTLYYKVRKRLQWKLNALFEKAGIGYRIEWVEDPRFAPGLDMERAEKIKKTEL